MYDIGICSGYFSILHEGHIQYLKNAKKDCRYLIVIVNNILQHKKKYGNNPVYDIGQIIRDIKYVDDVYYSLDEDDSVIKTLQLIRKQYPYHDIAFFNSGDRNQSTKNIKEYQTCLDNKIMEVFIDSRKVNSSSEIIEKIATQYITTKFGSCEFTVSVPSSTGENRIIYEKYNPPKPRQDIENECLKVLDKAIQLIKSYIDTIQESNKNRI